MRDTNREGPGDRELMRERRKGRAKPPWQQGVFTGHEGSVGSTAQAIKRNKRSR